MCEADALAAGGDVTPWIFPSEARTPLEAAAVYKRFRSLLSKAKLPRFRLYDLRHTFATHLLELSAPITYVAAQLGHAKPTTTLAYYAHWLPRGDKTWIDHLAEARGSKMVATRGETGPAPSASSVESTSSPVAQLVERLTVNQEVAGSSPARGANFFKHFRPFHHARPPLVPLSGSSDSPTGGSFALGFRSSALTHRLPWLGVHRA
jgi:hypothetical protein